LRSASISSKTRSDASTSAAPRSRRNTKRTYAAALVIALAVVIVRIPALFHTVAGADEGLYALVAREWLNGHLPYTTVWETKPPLFFALLAVAMLLFGKSMLAVRIASDVAVACTAFALYAIGRTVHRGGEAIGMTAALMYAALTVSDSGLSGVAEIFYAPFVAIGLALVLRGRISETSAGRTLRLIALGALLGCAILVKESAALEVAYVLCVIAWISEAAYVLPVALGVGLSLALSTLPYFATRNFGLFWDANVATLQRRALVAIPDVAGPLDILRAQVLAFFPASILAFGLGWIWNRPETDGDDRTLAIAMTGWALAALLTVVLIREYLGNHFIGAMAPLCVLSALVTVRLAERYRRPAIVPAVAALALLSHCAYQFILAAPIAYGRLTTHDPDFGDPTAQLGTYLVSQHAAGRSLYVADDRAVLYLLSGATPPTRYAYSAHLTDPYQQVVAGVDGPLEVARILATSPALVVRDTALATNEDPRVSSEIDRALGTRYHVIYATGTRTVYERSTPE
jgi:4-amino-4-deoxy-L-arabinose transferase-like glycosyltransferase